MRTWVTTTLPLAIIDIDGVILDNAHRLPHIVHTVDGKQTFKGADANWAAFHGAAQNELLSQMKFGSQPAYLVSLGQTNLCPHTVQDLVELFGLRSTVLIEGDDGVKKPLSMKDLDFNRGELCFKRKSS